MQTKARLIAYYLPQYHPIPENDKWWGKGFTEWTNVTKAKPLFRGHYQPRLPADFSFYDLRVPEVREQQAVFARENGISGFCYYHYWFGNGKRLLERPFNEVLESGKPDFPFMLCWANQTWQGVWFGNDTPETLIEQVYPGKSDYINHFNYLSKAFSDPRYITIDGKPVFHVYMPRKIPDLNLFVDTFRELAYQRGFKGLYLLATHCPQDWDPRQYGFDGVVCNNFHRARKDAIKRIINNKQSLLGRIEGKLRYMFRERDISERTKPDIMNYKELVRLTTQWPQVDFDYFPQVVPDWDNSPRAGRKSFIMKGSTPELWLGYMQQAVDYVKRYESEKQMIFIKSWNEWAEGNYLEPDQKWGSEYLRILRKLRP
jgi:hypothetical protein